MRGWLASLIQWGEDDEDSWGQELVVQQIVGVTTVGEAMSRTSELARAQMLGDSRERLLKWLDERFPPASIIPFGVFRD